MEVEMGEMSLIDTVVMAIWLMLPAYIANGAAAFFGGIFGRTPIDMRRNLRKNRILGDGKTYEGFFFGVSAGLLVGTLQQFSAKSLRMPEFSANADLAFVVLLCLCVGALLGDIAASFVKRRLGLRRGALFPLLDQLDFVAGAWLFLFAFAREWFLANFTLSVAIAVILLTPPLHLLTNFLGFKMRLKREAW